MPRRLPVKPDRFIGNLFICLVFISLIVVYCAVVVHSLGPKFMTSHFCKFLLAFYHFFCIMLVWCLFQTIMGDPGQVPTFWGFHFGDHESKRKRYCLMCNVFKPERCHHCSTCNRCVLNMDHHCPWVNNCIGFWNRKQFVLLLIYVLISAYFSFAVITVDLWYRLPVEYEKFNRGANSYTGFWTLVPLIVGWVITTACSYFMTSFLKFHIVLIFSNKTTIEYLEKKGEPFDSPYELSPIENWRQVFGYNPMLWFFPVSWASGHPIGDGVYWQTNQNLQNNNRPGEGNRRVSERKENNSEDRRLISENNSHQVADSSQNSAKNLHDNKENINSQSLQKSSSRTNMKYDPEKFGTNNAPIDTVVNRKDENNTLIVHSQDKNRMLKNTLIKK